MCHILFIQGQHFQSLTLLFTLSKLTSRILSFFICKTEEIILETQDHYKKLSFSVFFFRNI